MVLLDQVNNPLADQAVQFTITSGDAHFEATTNGNVIDVLRDRLRKEKSGYESGRHNEYPKAMRIELNKLADAADRDGVLSEYGKRLREMAETHKKKRRGKTSWRSLKWAVT